MITPSQDPVPSEVAEDTTHLRQLPKEMVGQLDQEAVAGMPLPNKLMRRT